MAEVWTTTSSSSNAVETDEDFGGFMEVTTTDKAQQEKECTQNVDLLGGFEQNNGTTAVDAAAVPQQWNGFHENDDHGITGYDLFSGDTADSSIEKGPDAADDVSSNVFGANDMAQGAFADVPVAAISGTEPMTAENVVSGGNGESKEEQASTLSSLQPLNTDFEGEADMVNNVENGDVFSTAADGSIRTPKHDEAIQSASSDIDTLNNVKNVLIANEQHPFVVEDAQEMRESPLSESQGTCHENTLVESGHNIASTDIGDAAEPFHEFTSVLVNDAAQSPVEAGHLQSTVGVSEDFVEVFKPVEDTADHQHNQGNITDGSPGAPTTYDDFDVTEQQQRMDLVGDLDAVAGTDSGLHENVDMISTEQSGEAGFTVATVELDSLQNINMRESTDHIVQHLLLANAKADELGEYDSSRPAAPTHSVSEGDKGHDASGDFHFDSLSGADTASSVVATENPTNMSSNDEGEGCLGEIAGENVQAGSMTTLAPTLDAAASAAINDDGDFGDFGDASGRDGQGTSEEKQDVTSNAVDDEEYDFGDFGDASGVVGNGPSPLNKLPSNESDEGEEDDFGDFGDASGVVGNGPSPLKKLPSNADVIEDDDNNNSDVGNFGDAFEGDGFGPSEAKQESTANAAVAEKEEDDDDDFGDFGDASGVVSGGPSEAKDEPPSNAVATEDDDFGDFGDASQGDGFGPSDPNVKQTSNAAITEDDDDDFGDFGEATGGNGPAEAKQEPTENGAIAEEDDDFGDFGEASGVVSGGSSEAKERPASNAVVTKDNDFGDFGDASAKSLAEGTEDLITRRIRTVIPRLFAKFETPESRKEADDRQGVAEKKESISGILTGLQIKKEESKAFRGDRVALIKSLTHRVESRKTSRYIVKNDAEGPYTHFRYPFGGSRAYDGVIGNQSNIGGVREIYVPEVLSIRLPTVDDQPIDMASPDSAPRKIAQAEGQQKLPALPDTQHDVQPAQDHVPTSESVAQFLKQIPDLSYMLKPTLTILEQKR